MEPIILRGYLDQFVAEDLKARALPLLAGQGDVVFDFSRVDRMHAASLQVLLALRGDLQPAGRNVILTSVESRVRELFRISGTEGFFTFVDGGW